MLTPEQIKEIAEAVKGSLLSDLTPVIASAIDAKVNPLISEQEEFFTRIGEKLQPDALSDLALDKLIREADELAAEDVYGDYSDDDGEPDYSDYEDDDDEPASGQLSQKEIQAMRENETLKRRLEALEQETQQAKRQAIQKELEANALSALSGKVLPGTEKQVLILLQAQGLLKEEGTSYKVPEKTKFGDALVDLDEALPKILESQFKVFLPPRDGTGSGTGNSSTTAAVDLAIDPNDIASAVNNPAKLAELTQQFVASQQQ